MENSRPEAIDRYHSLRCKWTHAKNQCQMLGTISNMTGEGAHFYCLFHHERLNISSEMRVQQKERDAFKEFYEGQETGVKCQFTSLNRDEAWAKVKGKYRSVGGW